MYIIIEGKRCERNGGKRRGQKSGNFQKKKARKEVKEKMGDLERKNKNKNKNNMLSDNMKCEKARKE